MKYFRFTKTVRFTTGHTMNPGDVYPINEGDSMMIYQEEKCDWEIIAPQDHINDFAAYGDYTCNLPVKKEDGYILEGDEHKLYEILTK